VKSAESFVKSAGTPAALFLLLRRKSGLLSINDELRMMSDNNSTAPVIATNSLQPRLRGTKQVAESGKKRQILKKTENYQQTK
jgi:hypothetical protein